MRPIGVNQRLLVEIPGHMNVVGAALGHLAAERRLLGTAADDGEGETGWLATASIATAAPLYGRSWPTNSTRSGLAPS